MITLMGKKVSDGIAIGKLSFFKRSSKEVRQIYVKDVEKEISRLMKAKERALVELKELYEKTAEDVGDVNATAFEIQQQILLDDDFNTFINTIILEKKLNAEYAVMTGVEQFIAEGLTSEKGFVSSHKVDARDLASRLVRILSTKWKEMLLVDDPFVLATDELYPSEAVQFEQDKALAFVTRYGTINSHTAILARTKGIPSIIGLGEALKDEYDGKTIIVDGFEGKIYIEPDYTTLQKMQNKKDSNLAVITSLERLKGKENITQSGRKIDVCANISSREDIEAVLMSDAGGIGLFRTEFMFLANEAKPPTEEQQFQVYKMAAETMGSQPTVIRVADLGGDKDFEADEKEETFGYRGIRYLLDKEEMLTTQLRGILRASDFGNVSILLPMITAVEEVVTVKKLVKKIMKDLDDEKISYNSDIQIGAMIETPAAVMISGELARELDFFSIGTNDLTQFTLAVGRGNEKLQRYFNQKHPALLKMIRIVTNNVHLEGKRISVCGNLAADLEMTEFFIKIGIDELSVAPHEVLGLRKKIRDIQ
ncbi:phosphotransferase system enzyme I (PtsI) [Aequitasia blattaphilus]|uniref:Phosphoenolpyruvate-protein phosphotransferase n=1 Tax=Aequitasia blattaphilus TaxID=2949332 RepID=A0ABT1E962_9FIRM|nr:phosphoenolpyruvate--protein phosphotransferase [Aequitasia blattaphilus]MCP1102318.1 phosphoenolpyruvate--protein phosphotransferase [Aequitasia blattaphilus]MCR8614958.1 phosphoenolpyruvate--protein phosphotransferase [Aequitasia blattaphilus]